MQSLVRPWTNFFLQGLLWAVFCVGAFVLAKQIDVSFLQSLTLYQVPWLQKASIFLTEYGIYGGIGFVYGAMVWRWCKHDSYSLVPLNVSILLAVLAGFFFKEYFRIDRPFLQYEEFKPLVEAGFYSFPSNHTTLAFAGLVPLWRLSKKLGFIWLLGAMAVAFSRMYQFVHFPSDVVGGIFLGVLMGFIVSHPLIIKLFVKEWSLREFRRQFVHFWFGIMVIGIHWVLGKLAIPLFIIACVGGFGISLLSTRYKIPVISQALDLFERPLDMQEFPGRGPLYFLLGSTLVLAFFEIRIAYASILILSAGDSFNHFFNRQQIPPLIAWNHKKNWLGLAFGIVMGTVFGAFFVDIKFALLASAGALFLETIPFRVAHLYINDNLFVPLVSATILSVLM